MKYLAISLLLVSALVSAQTCPVPAPSVIPHADSVTVFLPPDGGSQGCTMIAACNGCQGRQSVSPVGNGKCTTVRAMGDQQVANDNGWADGGVP